MHCRSKLLFATALCCFFNCITGFTTANASIIIRNSNSEPVLIGKDMQYLVDSTNSLPFSAVKEARFRPSGKMVPNFGLSSSTYWFKFEITNQSDISNLLLEIKNPTITEINFYEISDGKQIIQHSGEIVPISKRTMAFQNPMFTLNLEKGASGIFYLKVRSKKILSIPIFLGNGHTILNSVATDEYIFGIYLGIMLVMLFYNLFLFISVRDSSYLYYVLYIIGVGLAQAGLKGYTFKFLWPNNVLMTELSTNIFIALSGILSIAFAKVFLHIKKYIKPISTLLNIIVFIYLVTIALDISGQLIMSQSIIQINTLVGATTLMLTGILIQRKGFRPALFFNIAWSFFILSVIIYLLKDTGVLPFTNFTNNSILAGSAIEATLLSFALADKINIFKKEKEESQTALMEASLRNEQLIKEQNAALESTVRARTKSLQKANGDLNKAINDLKSTQSQLVHAEKMASLGQLTAGIAHEINNPINFVKSNIRPLQLDMEDLMEVIKKYETIDGPDNIAEKLKDIENFKKQIDLDYISTEIQTLIRGIEEGAVRTADIVKGLRTFSRLDESELKQADIHGGIDATLTLLRSSIPRNVNIIKHYGDVPPIECFAGKLNQVFMNILTNALQAIKSKPQQGDESITITTSRAEDHVIIGIADTGPGMPEEVKGKIFDPFFTTKDVGEGTGLGLSIVLNIIEKHHGEIEVDSTPGKGSEFIITLPMNQENKD